MSQICDNNSTEIPSGDFVELGDHENETTLDEDLADEMTLNFVKEREKKIIELQGKISLNDEILGGLKNQLRSLL